MHWLGKGWPIVLAAGLLAALAFPHLVGAYHLEAGGRALVDEGRATADAMAHLQRALDWTPDNAQAYRLMGQLYRAQGEELFGSKSQGLMAAAEALGRYTELRPDDPLGHMELAQVYEALEAEVQAMTAADLIAALPGATAETPDAPVDTPFAAPDEPAWHSYVAPTAFSLPPNFGRRPALFMHAPSWVTYTVSLPPQPAILRFGMGMEPQSHNWPGDGATFEVWLNGERIFLEHLDKGMAREGWHERTLDLSPWAGGEITLALAVTPGPVGDATGDWAGWGEPQVVEPGIAALEALHPGTRAAEEWRRAGVTVEDFIAKAEEERRTKQYDEAEGWLRRAIRLAPDLGDAWYRLGRLHESREGWTQALDAYERAAASGRFEGVGSSSPHYRAGILLYARLEPRRWEEAQAAFEAALAAGDFESVAEEANAHYLYGYVLRRRQARPDQYIAQFQRAIELNPSHAWAHVRLGEARYARDGDAAAAEALMEKGLALAPQNRWMHVVLGDLYRQEGRAGEAAESYRRALEIDPDFQAAQNRLEALEGE
jgi:tetratricopeptide (TPR) repeat protein